MMKNNVPWIEIRRPESSFNLHFDDVPSLLDALDLLMINRQPAWLCRATAISKRVLMWDNTDKVADKLVELYNYKFQEQKRHNQTTVNKDVLAQFQKEFPGMYCVSASSSETKPIEMYFQFKRNLTLDDARKVATLLTELKEY